MTSKAHCDVNYTVYLSSTLKDLESEREAVRQALSDECVVKHSYLASEHELTESCLQDVARCDVYILILGMRYGYIPVGQENPSNLSITELEYEYASNKPRLVFIKDEETIPFALTDAKSKEHPLERIEGFRKRAAEDQRPSLFKTGADLKLAVVKAFNGFKARNHEELAQIERRKETDFADGSHLFPGKSHIASTQMFSGLRAARFEQHDLLALGNAMTSEELECKPETPTPGVDAEENSGISAGYTYLGQFIDHDLTFSEDSSIGRHGFVGPVAGTAAFTLSCMYGKGPAKQPYLYNLDGLRMALGGRLTGAGLDPNARQIPRINSESGGPARALIADPRNDENLIISQLHAAMLRFHNRVADILRTDSLEEIQQAVRFHYQWVVLYDFLPTIIGLETLHSILPHMTARHSSVLEKPPRLSFYKADSDVGIPVEFSAAAYRFGHSMIRPTYRLNSKTEPLPLFDFSPGRESLYGFRNIPSKLGVDWRLFFQMSNDSPKIGPKRVQPSYKIDTSLSNLLGHLPDGAATGLPSLAARNLLRGLELKLPSGQAVAGMMGVPAIADHDLRVGSATEASWAHNKPIVEFSRRFCNNAPLWFYILAEAQQQFRDDNTPIRLGPVGGRIVGEVLVGLMYRDKYSFLNVNPSFRPFPQLCSTGGQFRMADLLMQSMQA